MHAPDSLARHKAGLLHFIPDYDNMAKTSLSEGSMDGKTTVKYLQDYIKSKDFHPELRKDYFLKLAEEVGELSRAMRKNLSAGNTENIKESIDEELWDIIYYALAIANCYDIDMESVIKAKEKINNIKYDTGIEFEENR